MTRITLADLHLLMEADEAANLCHKCHNRGHYSQECPHQEQLWSLALCPKPKPEPIPQTHCWRIALWSFGICVVLLLAWRYFL